jgi:putative transposase
MTRYSNDLRKKVIEYIKLGNSKQNAIKIFNISRDTLFKWIKLDIENKLFEIDKSPRGRKSRVDIIELEKYLQQHPDVYYIELAKIFNISKSQIHNIVTKLGYRNKKNKKSIENQNK